jgi:AcrR family transcriptional regulator
LRLRLFAAILVSMTETAQVATQRPKRKREPITLDKIVRAAIELIDRDGLDGLSMRKLGAELGIRGMSLYTHVPNKEALLFEVIREMFRELPLEADAAAPWQEQLMTVMRSFREIGLEHPQVFVLFTSRPWFNVSGERNGVEILRRAGFDQDTSSFIIRSASNYVLGSVAREVGRAHFELEENAPHPSPEEFTELFEFGLHSLVEGFSVVLGEEKVAAHKAQVTRSV